MRKKRLFWQILPPFLILIVVSLLAAAWYSSSSLHSFYLQNVVRDLEARADFFRWQIRDRISIENAEHIDRLCKELGKETETRLTVILPDGRVIGDTDEEPAKMEDHSDRPEFKEALIGRVGMSTRYSHTLKKNMMYVAVPVKEGDKATGVVRTSMPLASIGETLTPIYVEIAFGVLVIATAAIVLSFVISRRISRPLEEIKRGAQRFADGDLSVRLPVPESDEIGSLAHTMNEMARQLDERIRTITQQGSEQQAIFLSMVEGVLAVDADEHVISMNQAAGEMLDVNHEEAKGKIIQEAIRNTDIQKFVSLALSSEKPVEGETVLQDGEDKYLQLRGAILRTAEGEASGAVVVLNDVTRLRKLEKIRREFVSNVSHELRTPITSIKGFVETLQDGALKTPEDAERFLGIINKELDRLNLIIEDLLLLSRIEQDTEKTEVALELTPITSVLQGAVQSRQAKAEERGLSVDLKYDKDISTQANILLLENAVINLLDNAINHSEKGSSVIIEAVQTDNEIAIRVIDHGCGIEKKHLSRIFERFYRVDKARSRKQGGTGLGLAIVKHIVQAHGGHITVDSTHGEGSTFTIHLPMS
jgi:two-component system phosphate regulon sensor histidine kinase PhoR